MSSVVMKSSDVKELCLKTIDLCLKSRVQKRIDEINLQMKFINDKRAKQWFGDGTPLTFGEVEAILIERQKNRNYWYRELLWCEVAHQDQIDRAERILRACEQADEITMTDKDLHWLNA